MAGPSLLNQESEPPADTASLSLAEARALVQSAYSKNHLSDLQKSAEALELVSPFVVDIVEKDNRLDVYAVVDVRVLRIDGAQLQLDAGISSPQKLSFSRSDANAPWRYEGRLVAKDGDLFEPSIREMCQARPDAHAKKKQNDADFNQALDAKGFQGDRSAVTA